MKVKVNRNVKQDKDGFWWIVNRNGKMVRKVADHAIIQKEDKLWYVKYRNGKISNQGFSTLQGAFDYDDEKSRLKIFGIFILIVIVIALFYNLFIKQ